MPKSTGTGRYVSSVHLAAYKLRNHRNARHAHFTTLFMLQDIHVDSTHSLPQYSCNEPHSIRIMSSDTCMADAIRYL